MSGRESNEIDLMNLEQNLLTSQDVEHQPSHSAFPTNSEAYSLVNGQDENETDTLIDILRTNCVDVVYFLEFLGGIWVHSNNQSKPKHLKHSYLWKFFTNFWFIITRSSVFFSFFGVVLDVITRTSVNDMLGNLLVDVSTFIQLIFLILSMYIIKQQLQSKVSDKNEHVYYMNICSNIKYFFIFSILCDIFANYLWFYMVYEHKESEKYDHNSVYLYFVFDGLIVTLSTTCFLTMSLYFVVVDTQICIQHINKLILLTCNDELTIIQYITLRNNIKHKIKRSKTINTIRIVTAMLNIFIILVFIFINQTNLIYCCVTAGSKELVFVTIIFWKASELNELSTKFMKIITNCEYFEHKQTSQSDDKGYVRLVIGELFVIVVHCDVYITFCVTKS